MGNGCACEIPLADHSEHLTHAYAYLCVEHIFCAVPINIGTYQGTPGKDSPDNGRTEASSNSRYRYFNLKKKTISARQPKLKVWSLRLRCEETARRYLSGSHDHGVHYDAHLGISSLCRAGDSSTDHKLAYPLSVLASFSIALNTAHPRSRHTSSPVVRHI